MTTALLERPKTAISLNRGMTPITFCTKCGIAMRNTKYRKAGEHSLCCRCDPTNSRQRGVEVLVELETRSFSMHRVPQRLHSELASEFTAKIIFGETCYSAITSFIENKNKKKIASWHAMVRRLGYTHKSPQIAIANYLSDIVMLATKSLDVTVEEIRSGAVQKRYEKASVCRRGKRHNRVLQLTLF